MRIATWNLERKKPTSPNGAAAVDHLRSLDPDVMVLTEARRSFPDAGGHMVWSRSWGSDDELKVLMWSAASWTDVDDFGSADLPAARFVAGTTETPIGPVRVMGVCISWHMANVRHGDRNRRSWEDHITYCGALRRLIEARDPSLPLIVAGDYNHAVDGELVSRITPVLEPGGIVTTPRHQLDVVITEFGVAEVLGKTVRERAEALAGIAHPDFRDELLDAAQR